MEAIGIDLQQCSRYACNQTLKDEAACSIFLPGIVVMLTQTKDTCLTNTEEMPIPMTLGAK